VGTGSGGIRRNPKESRVNTGVPVLQEFLQKNPVTAAKIRNSCNPLQNHVPVKNSSGKHRKSKKSSGILAGTVFFGPKNKFLKTGICNLAREGCCEADWDVQGSPEGCWIQGNCLV
jgi:hypothetical protein